MNRRAALFTVLSCRFRRASCISTVAASRAFGGRLSPRGNLPPKSKKVRGDSSSVKMISDKTERVRHNNVLMLSLSVVPNVSRLRKILAVFLAPAFRFFNYNLITPTIIIATRVNVRGAGGKVKNTA